MSAKLTLSELFALFGRTNEDTRWVGSADSEEYLAVVTYLVQRSGARSPSQLTSIRSPASVTIPPRSRNDPSVRWLVPRYNAHTRNTTIARLPECNAMITILASRIRALMRWDNERGQALVEYSLIMCLVVIVILVTLIVLGNQVRNTYCNIQGAVVGA